MAQRKSNGSLTLEILIVILIVALVATIIYPKKVWKETEEHTLSCQSNMDNIMKAEIVFQRYNKTYTQSLEVLTTYFRDDTTKRAIRDYCKADTALAEKMLKYLSGKDRDADAFVRGFIADTMMAVIAEAVQYDSNLARVLLNRLVDARMANIVRSKRKAAGANDVAIFLELANEQVARSIYEPLAEDDSLKLVFNKMKPDVSNALLLDSLYSLKSNWAEKIDSAVFATMERFKRCPTVNREYKLSFQDSSAIDIIDIECPIDSDDIEAVRSDFLKYHLGHRRIENHGRIVNLDKSWVR
ncbi:MAG: type II secretion system protein [Candidatus Zhuqueibacterota bacterium]